ncbi:MAG: NAD-dependent epimerase/dehydratase family protein [Gemmatimonadetes bacterium]|nr:NAD-dependent epimerase/dehydratase family protein [Gemmatimonadota bacterium]NIO33380.1 NAD-dependent epimerase/dehydratase family protein [Gemmatimonadota bacterium]
MRVTVTGATGTIGMASVKMLVRAGHEVRGFARSAGAFRSRQPDDRVEVAEGDILDRAAVAAALEGADAVIHCVDFPAHEFAHNWDATRFTLEGLRPGGQFVLPGNLWVYGPPQSERVGPDHPKASPARLGEIRADLEKAVTAEGGTVVHLPDVYGPGVSSGHVYRIFRRALMGKSVWFPGDLDRPIELLYIEDAARALVAPLGRREARGADYTAPGPAPTTPREFTDRVFNAAGLSARLYSLPLALLNVLETLRSERRPLRDLFYLWECSTLLDGTLIRRDLGWVPEVDHAEGIKRTIRWLRDPRRLAVPGRAAG